MTNNTDQRETLDQFYEVLLYKKDIIAIHEKLAPSGCSSGAGISANANRAIIYRSNKAKTLADSYELLFELVGDLIPILTSMAILF